MFLDGTNLYSAQRAYRDDGSVGQVVLVALDGEAVPRALFESEDDQQLLDARGGLVLHASLRVDRTARRLSLRDARGEELASLIDPARDGEDLRLIPGLFDWGAATHMIDDTSVAWGEQRGTYGGPARVRTFHDGRLATLYDGEAQVAAPYLRNGWVAFLNTARHAHCCWL